MSLEAFLQKRVRNAAWLHAFGSLAALIAGIVAMIITFWVIYGAIWWGFQWCLPHSHQKRLIFSSAVLVILFIGNARTDREYLTTYEVETLDGRAPYTIQVPEVGVLSNLNFFSPNTINSLTKVIAQLLFIGPRLMTAAWRLSRGSLELKRIEVIPAARMAERLQMSKGRVPFTDLLPLFDETSADTAMRDLRLLDAIQFLDSHPAGVMLTSSFRETLNRAVKPGA